MNETHLIDGAMGRPHVNALDVRMHNAAMFGDGVYITEGLDGLPVTVVDANTVSVGRGVMLINGARITQEEKIDLTIESGSQGMNRNDLLVATYTYDAANTRCEDVNLEIVVGTPTADTATDPAIHAGTLLDINSADLVEGVSTVQVPIARIPLTGTTVGTPVILAKKFGTIQDIRDSVSLKLHGSKKFSGTASYWKGEYNLPVTVDIGKTLASTDYEPIISVYTPGTISAASIKSKGTSSFEVYVWTTQDVSGYDGTIYWEINQ